MEALYGINQLGALIETITAVIQKDPADLTDAEQDLSTSLKQLFIGPDTIFAGDVLILNANIFDVIDLREYNQLTISFSNLDNAIESLEVAANPRNSYDSYYKTGCCINI